MNVRQIREKLKITQAALADMCGVTSRTIQNWENGQTIPESMLRLLEKISAEGETVSCDSEQNEVQPAVMSPIGDEVLAVPERNSRIVRRRIAKAAAMDLVKKGVIDLNKYRMSNIGDGKIVEVTSIKADNPEAEIVTAEVVEELREVVAEKIKEEMAIPIISSEIASAPNTNIKKYIRDKGDELKRIYINDLAQGAKVAECVESTSMWPMFQPGDWVFIKFIEKDSIIDGKTYYFDLDTLPTMIRKLKVEGDKLRLIAKNPNYGDIIIGHNEVNNIAKIVGMWRSHFGDQYDEIEEVRRKKDHQINKLIDQNTKALEIISDLVDNKN